MAQDLPITVSSLTPGLYDVVTHLDEEIDYMGRSGSPSVKVIFILCRYLPFVIGIIRIPIDVVGAGVHGDKMCVALLRSSIWLCVAQMAFVEFIFLLRTYALWACSKRILIVLLIVYTAACITDIISIKRYNASLTPEACYGVAHPDASALLTSFVSLVTLEIGLFGITMYRALMQYRATSGRLLSLLLRHSIVYFAAGVALNLLNIVGILLDPVQNKWHTDVMEIVQILFQALLATRMQLYLWDANRRTTETMTVAMSMEDFAVHHYPTTARASTFLN
ncbi:hypothetical protein M405DRAFT_868642 [Rhizopogon salebrosus TDB-379]|nr:hypothetical protein M405DRAFT_868642 [Rhizopogon salebrosus TDB-379]